MISHRAVLSFLLLFRLSVIPHCVGSPSSITRYDYGSEADTLRSRKRQLSQTFVVDTLPRVDDKVPLRLEIRDLQKDEDMWNLFILALSWMQYTEQEDPFSWYQIAGIHGAPGLTWGNVEATDGNEKNGYCQHVSILFPTWHRPYLALYEQTLFSIVQAIASIYPANERDRLQKAAKSFRIPYWDWAATPPEGESVLPSSVGGEPTIQVSGPNGMQNISNPLFSYAFRPFNESIFAEAPFNLWNETKRWPTPHDSSDAISNNTAVAQSLDNHLPGFQQRLYNLFASYGNYTAFSNEAWIPDSGNGSYDSIESLHDSIHTMGGGFWGHLALIAYSAFDPLFFLHHANVDRIFAMWQLIYNDTYVVPVPAVYASHTMSKGDIQDSTTPLAPFFANSTSFWTSDTIRDHQVFGYTYAEVANQSRQEVIAAINDLYTKYSPATVSLTAKREAQVQPSVRANHILSQHRLRQAIFDQDDSYREWIVNVRVKKHAMRTSFSIYLFLGDIPDDTMSWPVASNLVGTLGIFAHSVGQHDHVEDGLVTGTIPLTFSLIDKILADKVASLRADDMEPFLRDQLTFGVALANGTAVGAPDVEGLGISVVGAAVVAPGFEDELARWGEVQSYFDLFP